MTPYSKGVKLPSISDVTRILSFSKNAYVTSDLILSKARRRSNVVEKQIKESIVSLTAAEAKTGHIRVRIDLNSPYTPGIELYSGAVPATKLTL